MNGNIEKTASGVVIDQIGHVLLQLIHTFAEAPVCANIFQAKWDIKDGFERLDCKKKGRMEFLLCLTTEARHANKTCGSNITSDGLV